MPHHTLTIMQNGGSRALVFSRNVTERGCGRLAVRLCAYFS
jgi:hypothetical protein